MKYQIENTPKKILFELGNIVLFTGETVRQFFIGPFETREMIKQGYYIGNKTLPLVSITGFIMGLVLTLQTRPVLLEFGAQSMLPGMIAVSIIREIGPMVTALLCAGKISSGIGAELGAMKVTEQLDAMEVSGTQPLNYVVATRVMATTLLVPILVFFADSGTIKVLNRDLSKLNKNEIDELRQKVGYLFQGGALYDSMSVRENLEFPVRRTKKKKNKKEMDKIVMEVLNSVGLNNGDGDFALLLNERNITTKLDRAGNEMLAFSSTANEIIGKINQGEGDLGKLINDSIVTLEYQKLMTNMDSVVQKSDVLISELNQYSEQLNNGDGILYRIAYDSVMADNMDTTVVRISNSVDDVVDAAETIDNSWIFNLFSKNKNKNR
jgi:energy-coupling factor transporter ATP-binding protein EcfA2